MYPASALPSTRRARIFAALTVALCVAVAIFVSIMTTRPGSPIYAVGTVTCYGIAGSFLWCWGVVISRDFALNYPKPRRRPGQTTFSVALRLLLGVAFAIGAIFCLDRIPAPEQTSAIFCGLAMVTVLLYPTLLIEWLLWSRLQSSLKRSATSRR